MADCIAAVFFGIALAFVVVVLCMSPSIGARRSAFKRHPKVNLGNTKEGAQ